MRHTVLRWLSILIPAISWTWLVVSRSYRDLLWPDITPILCIMGLGILLGPLLALPWVIHRSRRPKGLFTQDDNGFWIACYYLLLGPILLYWLFLNMLWIIYGGD